MWAVATATSLAVSPYGNALTPVRPNGLVPIHRTHSPTCLEHHKRARHPYEIDLTNLLSKRLHTRPTMIPPEVESLNAPS